MSVQKTIFMAYTLYKQHDEAIRITNLRTKCHQNILNLGNSIYQAEVEHS